MELTKEQVARVAALARIRVQENELSDIERGRVERAQWYRRRAAERSGRPLPRTLRREEEDDDVEKPKKKGKKKGKKDKKY